MFLGEIFQIQTQTINGWPDPTQPEPQKIDLTQPGSKKFDPGPSLLFCAGVDFYRRSPSLVSYILTLP